MYRDWSIDKNYTNIPLVHKTAWITRSVSIALLRLEIAEQQIFKIPLRTLIGSFLDITIFHFLLTLQAFECMLCEVAPIPSAHCPAGAWSKRATQTFIQLTENRKLAAKVK